MISIKLISLFDTLVFMERIKATAGLAVILLGLFVLNTGIQPSNLLALNYFLFLVFCFCLIVLASLLSRKCLKKVSREFSITEILSLISSNEYFDDPFEKIPHMVKAAIVVSVTFLTYMSWMSYTSRDEHELVVSLLNTVLVFAAHGSLIRSMFLCENIVEDKILNVIDMDRDGE